MSDRSIILEEYVDVTASENSNVFSMEGRRSPIFSFEISAFSGAGNLDLKIQTTNVDGTLHSSDAYWEDVITFDTQAGTTPPEYNSESVQDNGDTIGGAARTVMGRFGRIVQVISGGSVTFTGKVRLAYEVAITE